MSFVGSLNDVLCSLGIVVCGFIDVLGLLGVSFSVGLLNNVPRSLVSGVLSFA